MQLIFIWQYSSDYLFQKISLNECCHSCLNEICFMFMNFGIMILRKIDFDMIRYSVIFTATHYLTIFVWSSDLLSFAFMILVILVNMEWTIKMNFWKVKVTRIKMKFKKSDDQTNNDKYREAEYHNIFFLRIIIAKLMKIRQWLCQELS